MSTEFIPAASVPVTDLLSVFVTMVVLTAGCLTGTLIVMGTVWWIGDKIMDRLDSHQ